VRPFTWTKTLHYSAWCCELFFFLYYFIYYPNHKHTGLSCSMICLFLKLFTDCSVPAPQVCLPASSRSADWSYWMSVSRRPPGSSTSSWWCTWSHKITFQITFTTKPEDEIWKMKPLFLWASWFFALWHYCHFSMYCIMCVLYCL